MVAWIRDEPAADAVEAWLRQEVAGDIRLLMSMLNVGEAFYILAKRIYFLKKVTFKDNCPY